MTDDRIKRLNSINFTWEIKRKPRKTTTHDTVKFDVMFDHLVSFKAAYGHLKVNKLEKEWKKGIGAPDLKVYRRLPLFMAFVRKEQLLFVEGHACSLDEEKVRLLNDLGVEWRKPSSEPRKSTGGEASRKKRKRVDGLMHEHQHQQQQQENHLGGYYLQHHQQHHHPQEHEQQPTEQQEMIKDEGHPQQQHLDHHGMMIPTIPPPPPPQGVATQYATAKPEQLSI